MRAFLIAVGILSWIMALSVMVIFAASGGVLTVIASGVFAVVAVVALGCERIIRTLEEIRDAPASTRTAVRTAAAVPATPA